MLTESEKQEIIGSVIQTYVLFAPNKRIKVCYRLPGNVFSRIWFFVRLVVTGKGTL